MALLNKISVFPYSISLSRVWYIIVYVWVGDLGVKDACVCGRVCVCVRA